MYITIEFKINSKDLIECTRIGIHRASVTRERDLNHLNYVIKGEHPKMKKIMKNYAK